MTVEKAPLIVPEHRILIHLFMFGTGIALFHRLDPGWKLDAALYGVVIGAVVTCAMLWLVVHFVADYPRGREACLLMLWVVAGVGVAGFQFIMHEPPQLSGGMTRAISGEIIRIDGQMDQRSRLWLRLDRRVSARHGTPLPVGSVVRVTTDKWSDQAAIGARLSTKARLYPPPQRFISGTADFSLAARVNDVSASGFIIGPLTIDKISQREKPSDTTLGMKLAQLRAGLAKRIVAAMPAPSGAIAAALLFGERRYVSAEIYAQFQKSGLAHLLAISGLHMGLMCLGTGVLVRLVGACVPQFSVHFPLHKFAAVIALIVGFAYVILAGGAISAVRAYAMAFLVVVAVLSDRMALTIRNVALAAIAILAFNPLALFSASFQLSFAATGILVMWHEYVAGRKRYNENAGPNALVRYAKALMTTALLAALATAPFTAQHFGVVTPWGLIANIIGVPLTGLWIMPAGMGLALSMLFGWEEAVAPVMQAGLSILVELAHYFADLPFAGWRILQPGYAAIFIMVSGLFAMQTLRRPYHRFGFLVLALGMLVWWQRLPPDGVILGERRNAAIILVQNHKNAIAYAPLSDFARNLVSLRLAKDITDADPALCKGYCRHEMPGGRTVGVLLAASGIGAACTDAKSAFILTTSTWRQRCRTGKPIYNLGLEPPHNYLIFINENRYFTLVNNFGSSQRVCPEPRPRHC